jgi:DnaJ-class molecular chaperone
MQNTNTQIDFLVYLGVLVEDETLCPECKGEGFYCGTQVYYSAGGHFIEGEEDVYVDCPACDGAGVVDQVFDFSE